MTMGTSAQGCGYFYGRSRGGPSYGTGHSEGRVCRCAGALAAVLGTRYAISSKMAAQSSRDGCRATVTVTVESETVDVDAER